LTVEFNSTISTTRLYRAFDKHVPVDKVKVTRKLKMLRVGNTTSWTINYNK